MKPQIKYLAVCVVTSAVVASINAITHSPIPIVWDIDALHSMHLPDPDTTVIMEPASEAYYYSVPERVVYKTYPFYLPGKEPKGYFEWLKMQEPQIVFDPAEMKTEEDWTRAGEVIYDMPQTNSLVIMDSAFIAALPYLESQWSSRLKTASTPLMPWLRR